MMESMQAPSVAVRFVLDQLPTGTAIVDQHGCLCYANQALCTLTAVRREMLQDTLWLGRLLPEDRDKLRLTLATVARDQGRKRLEVRLLGMDHAEISAAVDLSPFSDEDGAPTAILVTFTRSMAAAIVGGLKLVDHIPVAAMMTDKTGQIEYVNRRFPKLIGYARIEEAARRQQEQLAHSARLIQLGEMASAMAHEINQPLTAIANFSGACMRALGDNTLVEKYLEKIEQQALRAGEIIWRMRDFARKRAQSRSPICLSELVTQVFDCVRNEARLYDVNLSIQVSADGLPKVRVDRVQIEQVLLNLVSNGIDAMRNVSHERVIEITVLPITEGKEILLSVRDTGAGVPEDITRNIFKPFFTTKESGLGLGLAVSGSIIEDHGGRLWLSSTRSAHGTTFFFTLPTVQNEQTI